MNIEFEWSSLKGDLASGTLTPSWKNFLCQKRQSTYRKLRTLRSEDHETDWLSQWLRANKYPEADFEIPNSCESTTKTFKHPDIRHLRIVEGSRFFCRHSREEWRRPAGFQIQHPCLISTSFALRLQLHCQRRFQYSTKLDPHDRSFHAIFIR